MFTRYGEEITSYVYACPNDGRCKQINWEKFGWEWKPFWIDENGHTRRDGIPYGFGTIHSPERDISFKCCTQCHKPVNAFAAMDLNKELGFSIPSIDDILESVKSTPSLEELLEGL